MQNSFVKKHIKHVKYLPNITVIDILKILISSQQRDFIQFLLKKFNNIEWLTPIPG